MSRKRLVPVAIVVIALGIIIGGAYLLISRASHVDQASVDKLFKAGCNEKVITELKKAYKDTAKNSKQRALRAEQIGSCDAQAKNVDDAIYWYRQAQKDYDSSGDKTRSTEMKSIADNLVVQKNLPQVKTPGNLTEEQQKQGIGTE